MEKLSPEFKKAVEALSPTEKDKLLFRLISLRPDLIKKLTYELLEEKETLDERTNNIQKSIEKYIQSAEDWFTPGNLLMSIRYANALITEHVKITKDKMGEVFLTLHLLNYSFKLWRNKLDDFSHSRSATLKDYIIKRTQTIIPKAQKLDPMFQPDITEQINELLNYIYLYPPTAILAEEEKLIKKYVYEDQPKKKR